MFGNVERNSKVEILHNRRWGKIGINVDKQLTRTIVLNCDTFKYPEMKEYYVLFVINSKENDILKLVNKQPPPKPSEPLLKMNI